MKHCFAYIMILFHISLSYSQKDTEKIYPAEGINHIQILCDECFRIQVETEKRNNLDIEMKVEGENNEQVVLITQKRHDSLFISTDYQPIFEVFDDKLAAHKAISINLLIKIPDKSQVYIKSDLASVNATGTFQKLITELCNGHFEGKHIFGDVTVNTLQGDIVLTTNEASINAFSKNGSVSQENLRGKYKVSLTTINGDILVSKAEE